MNEKLPKNEGEDSVNFIRHSKAGYRTYEEILKSENPQQAVDSEEQVTPDLPEKGVEIARVEAENFFASLNSSKDNLFFVSSNEARALETANVYREVAHEQGFTVVKPEHIRSELARKIGEGEIRTIENLSLNIKNMLLTSVFNPGSRLGEINWSAVDSGVREKWEQARLIINADDKGSWGANFFHHSEAVQEIFPEIKTAREIYEGQFENLKRLARFGFKKSAEVDGSIKILAFGHENYIGYALNEYFEDNEIKNCEAITVRLRDSDLSVERRGEEKKI